MGLTLFAYSLQAIGGLWMFNRRQTRQTRPSWLRTWHETIGSIMVCLVLLLLAIGIIGTLGHYGSLGHSPHLLAGLTVVVLVLVSAVSGWMMKGRYSNSTSLHHMTWRKIHIRTNLILFVALCWVSLTGWLVVQKYLP
jgi:Protein of unknown function (DUF4079)